MPAKKATNRDNTSGTFLFLSLLLDHPALTGNPEPCIQTTEYDADNQEHQAPGIAAWPFKIDPNAYRHADQRRDGNRPSDDAKHAQAKPNTSLLVTAGLYFTDFFGPDLLAEFPLEAFISFSRSAISGHIIPAP